MTYTTEKLKLLREKTGAGISNCKKALVESNGNIDLAAEILQKEGIVFANKKSHRLTQHGIITSYIHTGGKIGVLLQLNCETDFVAKRIEFQTLAKNLAMQIVAFPDFEYISIDHIPENVIKEKQLKESSLSENEQKDIILTDLQKQTLLSKPYLFDMTINVDENQEKYSILSDLKKQTLLSKPYLFDMTTSVEDHIKSHIALLGENIQIARFCRFTIAE